MRESFGIVEDDALLGIVYLPLSRVLKHRSQLIANFPISGGIGYAASAVDGASDTYVNVARLTLEAITTYAGDVRAARQLPGGIPVPPAG